MKMSECKTWRERNAVLAQKLSIPLTYIKEVTIDSDDKVHCENQIGSISIPLGVAGPLQIMGETTKGEYFIPLATTEGALVASVNRGAKACYNSGIVTSVERIGTTRGPVLQVDSLHHAKKAKDWIWQNRTLLSSESEKTSNHINLMDVEVITVGLYLFIRFYFNCDRAMGMNMATIASEHLIEIIAKKTKSHIIAVAGNYDVDKKPAWLNSIKGRGFIIRAETIISQDNIKSILKTTNEKIYNTWKAKCLIGSALSGSMGFNAHHANIIAAFFAATGQDLAHVVGGSVGMTILDKLSDGSLYVSVYLPDIMLGTIGGGTQLKTQREARSVMKTDSPLSIAEILGAGVLAGEVSLLASLSQGTLARAHKTLGR